jgi:FAD/FMN-containing dehydrogenase
VKKGIDFARENNIRLIVKGTGHDYLGRWAWSKLFIIAVFIIHIPFNQVNIMLSVTRSIAPNSLSIWTHHMSGISINHRFKPKGCSFFIDTPAITAAAGSQMTDINLATSLQNLTVISGGCSTVGIGGYLTGGGHSVLSPTYGLAADQVLEMDIVTPGGDILTVNECQNQDIFWAMRGVSLYPW